VYERDDWGFNCWHRARDLCLPQNAQSVSGTPPNSLDCTVHTHAHHGQICCPNPDYVHINGHEKTITVILAKHWIFVSSPKCPVCLWNTPKQSRLHSTHTHTHTHTHHGQICCPNTDYVHINRHEKTITVILAKHCIELPDDGSLVIRNMLEAI